MKSILAVAVVVGLLAPLYGQELWCFSKNCPETPATTFRLDRSNQQLNNTFLFLPALSAYKPVAPFVFSPSARQFFQYSVLTDVGDLLRLKGPGNAAAMVQTNPGGTIGTHALAAQSSSHITGPTFSTGQGGMKFTSASPKF